MNLLHLIITKIDGPVFDGEVTSVTVPGNEGEMTILPHHQGLVSPLKSGTITYRLPDGTAETEDVETGTLEVSNNRATILL